MKCLLITQERYAGFRGPHPLKYGPFFEMLLLKESKLKVVEVSSIVMEL